MNRFATGSLRILSVCVAGAVLAITPAGVASVGDDESVSMLAGGYQGEPLAVGSVDATAAIAAVVERAGLVPNEAGYWLLPPGTTVDAAVWRGSVLEIDLTVPPVGGYWYLSPLDQETTSRALGAPFFGDPAFGGTIVRARIGDEGAYASLEQFLLAAPPAGLSMEPAEVPLPLDRPIRGDVRRGPERSGPTAQAARQPTGALSGVTVFASAGHGWTAGDTTWYLQRPVLLGMTEDHGNVDQLNYFVHYAFNAGATVVPFRPVGWQSTEIVLDNDDPGVTFAGSWSDGSASKYYENGATVSGIIYKWTSASTVETATARYTPNITVTDFYPVYCFTIASSNRTLQTYRVKHSGGLSEVQIDHRMVGSGWIWLGNYYLEAGGDNYVEITNESTETGAIVADAIRWGHGVGDIVRPGPGTISGYPRDEECQRYWAESELGNNAAGFDSDIWDIVGASDGSDNVRCGAKWAREMNQEPAGGVMVDRWKRIHLEFHTNASSGGARGQICLITDLGATTYQEEFATILSDEVDADLLIIDDEFEHQWVDRSSPTYTSSYGAICTGANGDEFDATIVELAFHDNQLDAELLRDDRVRSSMARSCLHGIIRFLHSLPSSQVPLAFLPDTPRQVRANVDENGNVEVSWLPPLTDGARGDPATGYVVYESTNGYGFGNPIVLGDVLSTTITGLPLDETRYYRVAATNAGGESMPSEVVAVRVVPVPLSEDMPDVLIVNGFDRLRRQINPIQVFDHPPAYAGDQIERQIWRRSNSFDYVVQHAEALAANGFGFDSCSNEAVMDSYVALEDYDVVIWILGTESTEDATFTVNEQNKISGFLYAGGAILITGSEVGYDLIGQGGGVTFAQDTLQVEYAGDDAGTTSVVPSTDPEGMFYGLDPFDFDLANGACYDVRSPDVLVAGVDAIACLQYSGGTGGTAGIQFPAGTYNAVVFGFPFETISSAATRDIVMERIMAFLTSDHEPLPFDYDHDRDVDLDDYGVFNWCFQGPDDFYAPGHFCIDVYGEYDGDIDLADFALLQDAFGS